jgi:Spy/CpxP family protein refolding chaperone
MMKLKSKAVLTVSMASILGFTFLSGCKHHRFSHKNVGKKAEFIAEKIADELDMTEAQESRVKQIAKEIAQKIKSGKMKRQKALSLLKKDLLSAESDTKAIEKLLEEHLEAKKALHPFLLAKYEEFHQLLTAEQRTKLAEKIEKMQKHFLDKQD